MHILAALSGLVFFQKKKKHKKLEEKSGKERVRGEEICDGSDQNTCAYEILKQ